MCVCMSMYVYICVYVCVCIYFIYQVITIIKGFFPVGRVVYIDTEANILGSMIPFCLYLLKKNKIQKQSKYFDSPTNLKNINS